MTRFFLVAALSLAATQGFAQTEKEITCGYQAQVVDAIQKARIDNVDERDVQDKLLAEDPTWPENYNAAIPLIAPWVYELPMKQLRDNDLGDVWNESCLLQ